MTDPELIEKKLATIETYLRELETLAEPARLREDTKEERFVAHTLQLAIQEALDVASHIVSDDRLGEPRTNRELFTLLEKAGWLEQELADRLRSMAGFRNLLVHGYAAVDLSVLERVLAERLGDLDAFAGAVRARMSSE